MSLLAVPRRVLFAAPAGATKYAGEFMKIPVGARAVGMGGAFSAVADDATAPYWNPAGMVFLPYREAFLQHAEQFGSLVNHNFGSAVLPLGGGQERRAALGVSLTWVGVDDIPITPRPGGLKAGLDLLDYGTRQRSRPRPATARATASGIRASGCCSPRDDLFMASSARHGAAASRTRASAASTGRTAARVKFVRQSLPDTLPGEHVTSFGAGLDAGLLYMPTDAVTLGAVMHDLTTTYLSVEQRHARVRRAHAHHRRGVQLLPRAAPRAHLGHSTWRGTSRTARSTARSSWARVTADLRTGLEYWYRNTLALRTGLNGKDLNFGAGRALPHFGVDYAASLNRFFAADDPQLPGRQEPRRHAPGLRLAYSW